MVKTVLICAPKYGGCGLFGSPDFFPWAGTTDEPIDDTIQCRHCGEDHCFQLSTENFDSLTEGINNKEKERIKIQMLKGVEES